MDDDGSAIVVGSTDPRGPACSEGAGRKRTAEQAEALTASTLLSLGAPDQRLIYDAMAAVLKAGPGELTQDPVLRELALRIKGNRAGGRVYRASLLTLSAVLSQLSDPKPFATVKDAAAAYGISRDTYYKCSEEVLTLLTVTGCAFTTEDERGSRRHTVLKP